MKKSSCRKGGKKETEEEKSAGVIKDLNHCDKKGLEGGT